MALSSREAEAAYSGVLPSFDDLDRGARAMVAVRQLLRHFSPDFVITTNIAEWRSRMRGPLAEHMEFVSLREVQEQLKTTVGDLLKLLLKPEKGEYSNRRLREVVAYIGPDENSRREIVSLMLPEISIEKVILLVSSGLTADMLTEHKRAEVEDRVMGSYDYYSARIGKSPSEMPADMRALLHDWKYPPISLIMAAARAGFVGLERARELISRQLGIYLHAPEPPTKPVLDALRYTIRGMPDEALFDRFQHTAVKYRIERDLDSIMASRVPWARKGPKKKKPDPNQQTLG